MNKRYKDISVFFKSISAMPFTLPSLHISDIFLDSRHVIPDSLFIAFQGEVGHGQQYIGDAIRQGAAVICRQGAEWALSEEEGIPIITLPLDKEDLTQLLQWFYDYQEGSPSLVGITGTNGKSTVAYMLSQVLDGGYLGTLGMGKHNDLVALENTTPAADIIYRFIANLTLTQTTYCAMEVSSHALVQQRIQGLKFKVGVFTNLTHDHLDYHGSMDAYAKAKFELFKTDVVDAAVINIASQYGQKLQQQLIQNELPHLTYGVQDADLVMLESEQSIDGTKGILQTPKGSITFSCCLFGEYNLENIMAVAGVMLWLDFSIDDIQKSINELENVPGRMELVHQNPHCIVDYAHTPDALEKLLQTIQSVSRGKVWCVFGCGGDRDKPKRSQMGKIAEQYADRMVITNDNPRSESPKTIVEDIQQGLTCPSNGTIILDREQAITYCLNNAQKNDLIIIAGKGHETYQIIEQSVYDFSDQLVIKNYYGEP